MKERNASYTPPPPLLCRNLQVYMNPSPPHISGNRTCHQIIHHVFKILCTMTGVFLKNKKTIIPVWHYRPSNLRVHSASLWKSVTAGGLYQSPLEARNQGQAFHFCLATPWNCYPWNSQVILRPTLYSEMSHIQWITGRNNKICNILLILVLLQLLNTTTRGRASFYPGQWLVKAWNLKWVPHHFD